MSLSLSCWILNNTLLVESALEKDIHIHTYIVYIYTRAAAVVRGSVLPHSTPS